MSTRFDVFLSFKNLDSAGNQTRDSQLAHELYHFLSSKGLSVFQSNIVLEKLGETAFKKVIDDALDSAQILVAIGTTADNLESKWVRYEWDSFFTEILDGIKPNGKVFTYIDGIQISDLPRSLRQTQTISHSSESQQKLYNFIVNALKLTQSKVTSSWADSTVTNQEDSPNFFPPQTIIPDYFPIPMKMKNPMDIEDQIENLKQDSGLSTEDKKFLIYMHEVTELDRQHERLIERLAELDKKPDLKNVKELHAVRIEQQRLKQLRDKKMAEAEKIMNQSTRNLAEIFKKL